MADVTTLLGRWSRGEQEALAQLMPAVYAELRRLGRQALWRERGRQTMQPTALVHEAFLRLIPQQEKHWHNREHFFAVCAQLMRQVLVDQARRRRARKRGSGELRVTLDEIGSEAPAGRPVDVDVLDLDRALSDLASIDPARARIVELRYFGGLTIREIGTLTKRPDWDVKKDWLLARTWLKRKLHHGR